MNQPFSPETLEELIYQNSIAKPTQEPLYASAKTWRAELLAHPDRFREGNNEFIYLGFPIGIFGNHQEIEELYILMEKILLTENNYEF